jgi:hypothetical protein
MIVRPFAPIFLLATACGPAPAEPVAVRVESPSSRPPVAAERVARWMLAVNAAVESDT